MEKKTQKLEKAIRDELLPLFIGLRNELKDIGGQLNELIKKEPPEKQKVLVENQIKEVEVRNFPELIKSEITNPQKEVEVKGIEKFFEKLFDATSRIAKSLNSLSLALGKEIKELANKVFKVEVQNQQEINFPDRMDVKILNPDSIKQEPPIINFPAEMKISNSEPRDAIPVVLTHRDKKRFYDVINQLVGVTDINLDGVKKLLEAIKENTANIVLNADTVNVNVDELEELFGKTLRQAFGEATVSSTVTESTLASFIVPTGKSLRIKGVFVEGDGDGIFRLYVAGTKKWQARNAWTSRSIGANQEIDAGAGDTVALKVVNAKGGSHDYSGSFYGYEL